MFYNIYFKQKFILLVGSLFFFINPVLVKATTGTVLQEWFLPRKDKRQDIIGLRVIDNHQYQSVLAWYQQQKFLKGSPQSTIVDGYSAVRDGRTVYVSALNAEGSKLYPYIYLISYNENAEEKTIEIFNRLLKNWRFNVNITDEKKLVQIRRDAIRLTDLKYLENLIENYKRKNGTYPMLTSGSYIKGMSISTWEESWKRNFASDLGVSSLPVSPINKLGKCIPAITDECWNSATTKSCNGYDKKTCWNEAEKKFSGSVTKNSVEFPPGSNVYFYKTNNGTEYTLGVMPEYAEWVYTNNCIENLLTNVDFENSEVGVNKFPSGWGGWSQANSTVGVSNEQARSGSKSIKIHRDPNQTWPGKCSQEECNTGGCSWDKSNNTCTFGGRDYCHLNPPYVYNAGENFCWPNTRNVMYAIMSYNIANLDFKVGKKYRIQFYYKGKLDADSNVLINAGLGWGSFCAGKDGLHTKQDGTCSFGNDCAEQAGVCCAFAPYQKKCYETISAPLLKAGNYPDWQQYTADIIYTEEMNSHVNEKNEKINVVGIQVNYGNTGEGTDFYIDDFTVGPVFAAYITCSWEK